MMKKGFHKMSLEEYHHGEGKDSVSKSGLSTILKTPRKFKYEKDNPEILDVFDKKAEKFNRGTAAHTYFLEPEKFEKEVIVIPSTINRRTNAGKAEWAGFTSEVKDKNLTPIKADYMETIKGMSESLHSGFYETARNIIEHPKNSIENSGFWEDLVTGIPCKTRPDILASNCVTWDIKAYANASWRAWQKQAFDLDYPMQAAMALDGVTVITGEPHKHFGFIVFESDPPYDISVFICDEDTIDMGRARYQNALKIYAKCLESDIWPGYVDEIFILSPPSWAKKESIIE